MRNDDNKKQQETNPENDDRKVRVVNAEELSKLPEVDKDERQKAKDMIWGSGSDGGSAGDGGAA